MILRRLIGVLLAGSIFAVGYVVIKGPSSVYQIGGTDGFYLSGWRVIGGSVGILVGLPMFLSLFGIGSGSRNWQLGIAGSALLAGVLALVLTASYEPPVAATSGCSALADLLEDESPSARDIDLTLLLGAGSDVPEIPRAAANARAALNAGDEHGFRDSLQDWATACSK